MNLEHYFININSSDHYISSMIVVVCTKMSTLIVVSTINLAHCNISHANCTSNVQAVLGTKCTLGSMHKFYCSVIGSVY